VSSKPTVELLTNPRAGTIGVGLATGVLQPALAQISHGIGQRLLPLRTATKPNSAASAVLNDPLSTAVVAYRPFPSHAALGLSAFYLVHCSRRCGLRQVRITGDSRRVLAHAVSGPMPELPPNAGARPVPALFLRHDSPACFDKVAPPVVTASLTTVVRTASRTRRPPRRCRGGAWASGMNQVRTGRRAACLS